MKITDTIIVSLGDGNILKMTPVYDHMGEEYIDKQDSLLTWVTRMSKSFNEIPQDWVILDANSMVANFKFMYPNLADMPITILCDMNYEDKTYCIKLPLVQG